MQKRPPPNAGLYSFIHKINFMKHREIQELKQKAVALSNVALRTGLPADQMEATRAHIIALESSIEYDQERLRDLNKSLDTLLGTEIKQPVKRVRKPAVPVLNTKPTKVVKATVKRKKK